MKYIDDSQSVCIGRNFSIALLSKVWLAIYLSVLPHLHIRVFQFNPQIYSFLFYVSLAVQSGCQA